MAGQYIAEHPDDRQDRVHRHRRRPGGASCRPVAGNLKKVQLELGGKGANIVFDDANLAAAVNGSAFGHLPQPGPGLHRRLAADRCTRRSPTSSSNASSRWRGRSASAIRSTRRPRWGRSPSQLHRDRVLGYVDVAREQGGEVLTGGKAPDDADARAAAATSSRRSSRAKPHRPRRAGRGVRPVRHGAHVQRRRGGAGDRQRHRLRPGRRACGRATCSAPTASRGDCTAGMVWINCYKRVNPGLAVRRRRPERLRPRDGLRGDARIHAGRSRSGSTSTRRSRLATRAERHERVHLSRRMPSRVVFGAGSAAAARARDRARSARSARWCCRRPSSASRPSASPSCSASAPRASSPRR